MLAAHSAPQTRPMLDHMCDESDDRKHFHTACGEHLCGFVNQMQSQMIFTTLWGPPPQPPPPPAKPLAQFDLCWKCKPSFNTSYCLYLPEFTCTHNQIESIMEPTNREFCVNNRVMLDGHTVKLAHSEVATHNVSLDSLFYLPGAHYVATLSDPTHKSDKDYRREQRAKEKQEKAARHKEQPSSAAVVETKNGDDLAALLDNLQAQNELLRAELDEEKKKFRDEARRWTDLFNHKSHLFGDKANVQLATGNDDNTATRVVRRQATVPRVANAAHVVAPAENVSSEPNISLFVRLVFVVLASVALFAAVQFSNAT